MSKRNCASANPKMVFSFLGSGLKQLYHIFTFSSKSANSNGPGQPLTVICGNLTAPSPSRSFDHASDGPIYLSTLSPNTLAKIGETTGPFVPGITDTGASILFIQINRTDWSRLRGHKAIFWPKNANNQLEYHSESATVLSRWSWNLHNIEGGCHLERQVDCYS